MLRTMESPIIPQKGASYPFLCMCIHALEFREKPPSGAGRQACGFASAATT